MKPSLQALRMSNTNPDPEQLYERAKEQMNAALNMSNDDQRLSDAQITASQLFLAAAKSGHKPAQLQFGLMLLNGILTERNYIFGMHWIEQSIINHRDNAMWLAGAYMNGHNGIKRNAHLAASIYKSLAISNDIYAIYSLGCLHEKGLGVEQSFALARMMFERAAKKGHYDAQKKLSQYYSTALGGEANIELAKYWSDKANNNSDKSYAQLNKPALTENFLF